MPQSIFLPPGKGLIDLLTPENITAHDGQEIKTELLPRVTPEAARLRAVHADAKDAFAALGTRARELSALVTDRERKLNELRYNAYLETIQNPACDYTAIASQQTQPEAESNLLRESLNLLNNVQLPQAQELVLGYARDSARMDALEASLFCALEQSETLRKTESAFPGAKVAVVSQAVIDLENATKELERRAAEAERALQEFRTARQTRLQQRMTAGQLTRAEALYSAVINVKETTNA